LRALFAIQGLISFLVLASGSQRDAEVEGRGGGQGGVEFKVVEVKVVEVKVRAALEGQCY
jgi:hypothetical protein